MLQFLKNKNRDTVQTGTQIAISTMSNSVFKTRPFVSFEPRNELAISSPEKVHQTIKKKNRVDNLFRLNSLRRNHAPNT